MEASRNTADNIAAISNLASGVKSSDWCGTCTRISTISLLAVEYEIFPLPLVQPKRQGWSICNHTELPETLWLNFRIEKLGSLIIISLKRIAFTGRPFKNRILGLSYMATNMQDIGLPLIGGICESYIGYPHLNVLALSLKLEAGYHVPMPLVIMTLAHELGHSFGSPHDDQTSEQCGGYLMANTTLDGSLRNHFMFSPCSKKKIAYVIKNKGFCLQESFDSFCGNGLLEHDEECDCGLEFDCLNSDKCCTPRGAIEGGCRVNRGAGYTCHPSQGLCCTNECQVRDLHYLGLNCTLEKDSCPCPERGPSDCDCGLLGSCIEDTCHSIECTRLNLKECRCMGKSKSCRTCCKDPTDGSCKPSLSLTTRLMHEGSLNLSDIAYKNFISPAHVYNNTFIVRKFSYRNKSVELAFRIWEPKGFCATFGKLGICSAGVCDIKQRWKLQPMETSNSAYVLPEMIVFVLCYAIHLISHGCLIL
ncbi:hypothetical protein L9F63_012696 [Diploptera punctata]|uniref:Disintegrin and metalloproteinase domain-containing protein 10 n=1 Tax=Diploptera punctata TaxID=6984 RepID=A0AAD8ENJ2_DIPPU|nr:hypothetical protein L9F63_012696 [Diploptera punctata]